MGKSGQQWHPGRAPCLTRAEASAVHQDSADRKSFITQSMIKEGQKLRRSATWPPQGVVAGFMEGRKDTTLDNWGMKRKGLLGIFYMDTDGQRSHASLKCNFALSLKV